MARGLAESNGEEFIDIAERDMDVMLSTRGEQQAEALGRWLARPGSEPGVVLSSPYVRASRTAEIVTASTGAENPVVIDERLREREFGVLDRLTRRGIETRFPEEATARARVGKFYYRPPGGESWCDVALRVRSFLDSVTREFSDQHLVIVTHEVVILMFRYVIERLSEHEILAIGTQHALANCSITTYERTETEPSETMTLRGFNELEALDHDAAPVTHEPDVPLAPR